MGLKQNRKIFRDFKAGYHSAFTLIYNQHIDMLFAYGTKMCKDDNLVKDCIQEVFIKLFERIEKIQNPDSIKFYLLKSLKNNLIDSFSLKKKIFNASEKIEFIIEYSAEKYWIDNEINDLQRNLIKEALNALTNKQKEIIYLRYNQGLSFSQISEILDIDAGSAKKQTYRTLEKLRKLLDKDGKYQSKSNYDFFYMLCL